MAEQCLRCDEPAVKERRCQYHYDRKHLDNPDGTAPIPRALLPDAVRALREKVENVELACERLGLRDAAKRAYEAKLALSETLRALAR